MKLRTLIATATTAAVLATGGVALAGAATSSGSHTTSAPTTTTAAPTASSAAKPAVSRRVRARRLRIRKLLRGAGGIVTKTIGIDRKTLRTDLRSGMTVAQIATANNVDPQTVINALVAALDKKIDAAVQAGWIGSARAAVIERRLPARITKLVDNWHPKHAAA